MLESEAPSIFLFPILAPAIREHRGFEEVAKGCEWQLRSCVEILFFLWRQEALGSCDFRSAASGFRRSYRFCSFVLHFESGILNWRGSMHAQGAQRGDDVEQRGASKRVLPEIQYKKPFDLTTRMSFLFTDGHHAVFSPIFLYSCDLAAQSL